MDTAHGRGRRQPSAGRRDLDTERHPHKEVKSATSARTNEKSPSSQSEVAFPSNLRANNRSNSKDGAGNSDQLDDAGVSSRTKGHPDSLSAPDAHRLEKRSRSHQQTGNTTSRSKVSDGNEIRDKYKTMDTSGRGKAKEDKSYMQKNQSSNLDSKVASQTPKNKRRSRSASRSRDAQILPAQPLSPSTQEATSSESKGHSRSSSIPIIWLSREGSQRGSEITDVPDVAQTQKRRMSAFSQAKLALEKVAMVVTDTQSSSKSKEASSKKRDKKDAEGITRSQSTPRETLSPTSIEKHSKKKKTHAKHLSMENSSLEKQGINLANKKSQIKSGDSANKVSVHSHKTEAEADVKYDDRPEIQSSAEGGPQPPNSASSSRRSSIPFKLLQAITRPSSIDTATTSTHPHLSSPPSRPRKKFSRGHIDQDPLEVDYEILDDRVTSLEARRPSSLVTEPPKRLTSTENNQGSIEEPLLLKHRELDKQFQIYTRESPGNKPIQRPTSISYVHTFPRTKQPSVEPYSPSSDQFKPIISPTLPAVHHKKPSSNQLQTPESGLNSLHKIPSQSSFTSSDARSDVCLDLPDVSEQAEGHHLPFNEAERDLKVKIGFPSAPFHRIAHFTQFNLLALALSAMFIFLVSFLFVWPLIITIIFIVPVVVLIKRVCSWLCCCWASSCRGCCLCLCHTHLTSSELMWLGRSSAGGSAVVQSLLVLQKGLDTDRIRNLIDSRLISMENRRGHKLYPRFSQKVVSFSCGRAWARDYQFSLSRHVFNMPGYIETLEDLQQFISKMAAEPLSLDRPLWEIQVLHNFREPRDTVLLFRMHASMTDGVTLVQVLENALVDSQKISHSSRSFSAEVANTSPFKVLFSGPITFLSKYLFLGSDFNLLHGRHVRPSGEMVVAWSEPYSLSAAMRVKQVARCTLTELLLSITAGNIRTYLQVNGVTHPYDVKCAVPVDFQAMNGLTFDMENKYSVVILPLPTNTEGAVPRLWQVKYDMARFKSSAESAIVNGARWLTCSVLPVSFFQRMWGKIYSHCTLLVANLAGPTSVLKIDSREVKCMMYWLPPLERVPLTVSFITYADQIRMAVISERSVIPNPDLLTRDFNHKLEVLSKLLAHRRIPGESAVPNRQENFHLLSSFTLDDLTADQIQLEMTLVQQELHDLKIQLDSGSSHHISHNDTQLMNRIEALKERSRELIMHLRRRRADESENILGFSEEDDLESEVGTDRPHRPFRRRTLSVSSKMSTASVSSTARPLSTASTSNLPSPIHTALPSWPEGDFGVEELDDGMTNKPGHLYMTRAAGRPVGLTTSISFSGETKGRYHSLVA